MLLQGTAPQDLDAAGLPTTATDAYEFLLPPVSKDLFGRSILTSGGSGMRQARKHREFSLPLLSFLSCIRISMRDFQEVSWPFFSSAV